MTSILLVDDSATILMSMSSILGRAGYQVEQAESGEAAMGKLKGGIQPKLISCTSGMIHWVAEYLRGKSIDLEMKTDWSARSSTVEPGGSCWPMKFVIARRVMTSGVCSSPSSERKAR